MKSEYTIVFQILNQWNFHFHLIYSNTSLYVVERLSTRQGLWLLSFFYTFRVFLTPELLDMISKLKESLNNKFKTFKEFIQDCFIFAHNKSEEKVRKY